MNYLRPVLSTGGGAAAATAVAPVRENRCPAEAPARVAAQPSEPPKAGSGYGLPCAQCRKYYPANLKACPICKSERRVSSTASITVQRPAEAATPSVLELDRQRVLRQLKAQMYAAHTQVPVPPPGACSHSNDQAKHEPATICRICYARLQQRVDLMEAALLMNLQEAAQVIYDAVWADTSDGNKTYRNAAQALLQEVRRRAGLKAPTNRVPAATR